MGSRKRTSTKGHKPNGNGNGKGFPVGALALMLFVAGAALYWNTLNHEFVFDDTPLITQNLQVTELNWGEMLGLRSGYRPVRTLTYAFNYWLGGENPQGYHLFNILLHALNGVLLFRLLLAWTGSSTGSFCGAAVFLMHPVQTEAVAYVSGRKDLLATFFILAAFLVFNRYRQEGGKLRLAAVFGLFVLGILSKEVALVFPALLLTVDALILKPPQQEERPGFAAAWLGALKRSPWIPAGALLVSALGLYYAIFIIRASRMVGVWGGSWANNLGTSFKLFAHYLKLTIWPHPLIADYTGKVFPVSQGLLEPATLFSILLTAAFVGFAVWIYSRRPLISGGLFWLLIALLPVLQLLPFHELAADRFLYLPLVGFALVAACVMQHLTESARVRKFAYAGIALVVTASAVRTVGRNGDWHDQRTLWETTYQEAPDSFRANTNLGRIYFEDGKTKGQARLLRKGVELTGRALELAPNDSLALANMGGMTLDLAGEVLADRSPDQSRRFRDRSEVLDEAYRLTRKALGYLETSLEMTPTNGAVINNIGNCYKRFGNIWHERGDEDKALQNRLKARDSYEMALQRDRRKEQKATWYNYAMLYVDAGMHQQAVEALKNFLEYFPNHADGNSRMGISLLELGKPAEAVPFFEKAVRYRPSLDNLFYLAQSLYQAGRLEDAAGAYQALIRLFPDAYAAYFNLGLLYRQTGSHDAARKLFEAVIRNSPEPDLVKRAQQELQSSGMKATGEDVPR